MIKKSIIPNPLDLLLCLAHQSIVVIENISVLFYHSFHIFFKKIVQSNKLNCIMKKITPILMYPHICLYSKVIRHDIFATLEFFIFSWNVYSSKTMKICFIITIHIESDPLSSNWFVFIKIYYACPVFILGKSFHELNTTIPWFLLIISLYLKIW